MGLSESKLVVEAVSVACAEAEKASSDRIESVLTDRVIDSLHNLWADLPDIAKRKIDPGRGNVKKNTNANMAAKRKKAKADKQPQKKRKTNESHESEVALLPYILKNMKAWKENPVSFFHEGENRLDLTTRDRMDDYMEKLESRSAMDQIRGRFLKVTYFRLSGWVGWTTELQRKRTRVKQAASSDKVLKWVDEGNRFDALCRKLGCERESFGQYFHLGNLFYSLPGIVDTFVIRIGLKADSSQSQEIQQLKKRSDFCDVSIREELEELADKITNTIWAAYTKSSSPFSTAQAPFPDSGSNCQNTQSADSPSPSSTERSQFDLCLGGLSTRASLDSSSSPTAESPFRSDLREYGSPTETHDFNREGSQYGPVCSPEYRDPRREQTSSTQNSCHEVFTPQTIADHTEAPLPNLETDSGQSDPHLLIGNEISHESFPRAPPPGSSDAYANFNQTGPPWPTGDEISHESFPRAPPPGSSDAYANFNQTGPPWPTGDAILHELFPRDASPPGSTNVYANEIEPTHGGAGTTPNVATRQRNNCPVDGAASTSEQAPLLQPAYQFSLQGASDPRTSLYVTGNDQTQSSRVREDTSLSALHYSQSSSPFERAGQGQRHRLMFVV